MPHILYSVASTQSPQAVSFHGIVSHSARPFYPRCERSSGLYLRIVNIISVEPSTSKASLSDQYGSTPYGDSNIASVPAYPALRYTKVSQFRGKRNFFTLLSIPARIEDTVPIYRQ